MVGDGASVSFWSDLRWDSFPLKSAFLRIYELSSNKVGVVKEYGRFEEIGWV